MGEVALEVFDVAAFVGLLRERVPGLPDDLAERLDEPIEEVVGHAQRRTLQLAFQLLVPDMPGEVFAAARTLADVHAWLANAAAAGRLDTGRRLRRTTYQTAEVRLRPLIDSDVGPFYVASLEPSVGHRWRFRGRTPSPEVFGRALFDGVLAQFVVSPVGAGTAVGLVSAYHADVGAGFCYLAFQRAGGSNGSGATRGAMVEGALLFIQYLFDHWPLRKIYLEVPEYNEDLLRGFTGGILLEEGRFADHFFFDGRYWSLVTYALYRDAWESVAGTYQA